MLPRESMKQLSLTAAVPVLLLLAAAAFEMPRLAVYHGKVCAGT